MEKKIAQPLLYSEKGAIMLLRNSLLGVFMMLLSSVWAKDKPLLLVADKWPPMTDVSLKEGGFSLHLAKTLLTELGYNVKVKFQKWKRIERDMGSDNHDVIVTVWYTPERAKLLHYTQPYMTNQLVFISTIDNKFRYTGPESLKGKTIGLTASYAYPDEILNAPGVRIKYVAENRQNILKLDRARIDLTLGDYLVMRSEAQVSLPDGALYYDLENPVAQIPVHMAVSRQTPNHEDIVSGINRLLVKYQQDGTFSRLQREHGME